MHTTLSKLIKHLNDAAIDETNVIPWSCPVPSFGDLYSSKIATLGLNPSNREFVDIEGKELEGNFRRFHTLKSLGLDCWSDANVKHIQLILDSCRTYFSRSPYDRWFKKLDYVISGTKTSYYDIHSTACHLDLIPYATMCKWSSLTRHQRLTLLSIAGDTLGLLLRESPIQILVLNGNSVVDQFQEIAGVSLEKQTIPEWSLPRSSNSYVRGFAYKGMVQHISGIKLKHKISVLGFNHNIQSSFGVTTQVTTAIRNWIAQNVCEVTS